MMKRCVWVGLISVGFLCETAWSQGNTDLLTAAEKSDFRATASSDEVNRLCELIKARSRMVKSVELGRSHKGRPIPALIVSNPPVSSAEEAKKSGKVIVLAIGNIHAGEVDGKEALPMLVRDLACGTPSDSLADVVLIVVPNINPDGNDQMAKTNRPGQKGPDEGMGTRENAQGLDLNRDFVKLESPEIGVLVAFINEWNPHIFIDTHTTNGSNHRFTITHAGPKSPAGSRSLNDLVHLRMLPAIGERMRTDHGWRTFAYGNFDRDHSRWVTYGSEPRYSTSYVGLRNRISVLSEAYAYASFKDRVLSTRDFVAAILNYAVANKSSLLASLEEASKGSRIGDEVAVRSELRARPDLVTVHGFIEERNNGRWVATSEEKDYEVELLDDFAPKETVLRPWAYLIPPGHAKAVETLKRHGLQVRALDEASEQTVEVFTVNKVQRAEKPFQNHLLVLDIAVEPHTETRELPAGTYQVDATGPLGALAVMLLEPRSEDGLATWNFFDEGLEVGKEFPVLRLPSPPKPENASNAVRSAQQQGRESNSPPVRIGSGLRATEVPGAAGFVRWIDDEHFAQLRDGKTFRVHAETGKSEPLPAEANEGRAKLGGALALLPTIEAAQATGLAQKATLDGARKGAFVSFNDDLYFGTLDGSKGTRLTSTPGIEELAEFSPDGKFVAFVRDNDLYVVDVLSGIERALTTGGSDRVRHGKADWVYFEEIFDRSWKAFWWSPDSKHIAFLDIDDRMVPSHHVLVETKGDRVVEETAYPRAGDPNPQVRMAVVNVAGGAPKYADLSNYSADSFLISDVGWWPDGSSAYCYAQDRAQTWLDFLKIKPADGATTRLFRESTGAWVESLGPIHVLKDGTFLVSSERDGWKHLYRYNPDGSLQNRVTSGEWEVRGVSQIDEEAGWVYMNGTRDNSIGNNLYRAKLDGSSIERLTQGPGTHAGVLNPAGTMLVDLGSSRVDLPRAAVRKADGSLVRELGAEQAAEGTGDAQTKTEILQIKTRDGFALEAELIFPPNFDDSGKTLYPVWLTTYGGPHAPTISDVWRNAATGLNAALLREGYIIFRVDPRSASGKGAKSAWSAYRKLGVQELEDIKDAVAWLKEHPYVDGSRIGMSGHSYGGYLTSFCMTHSNLFAAGIAGAPVTDWRDYDSIYTERYMGTPQENPDGYDASSVLKAAGKLHGKLLILHGAIDDNVSVRNTMRFIHALQQADKDFELMIYPSARHRIGGAHYTRLQREFILRTLGRPKPKENAAAPAPK